MNRILLLAFIFIAICGCSKKAVKSVVLKKDQDSISVSFVAIDSLFNNKHIIGAGEATHGTHEFATIRLALFQYLVRYKGFTTFMLEADYATCLRLNRYVQGEPDSIYSAIYAIRLWPFTTKEMAAVAEWMRAYNNTNPVQKLRFRGADIQYGHDDVLELRRLFEKYALEWKAPAAEFPTKPDSTLDSATLKKWMAFTTQCPEYFSVRSMTPEDARDLKMILTGFQFYLHGMVNQANKIHGYRDSCMAINLLQYANLDNSGGIFFWAHNGHIMHYPGELFGLPKPCGSYLKQSLANRYLAIATEMNSGKIYAMSWNKKIGKYEEKISNLNRAPRHTLPWLLAKNDGEIQYMRVADLPYPARWSMTTIGAAYPNLPNHTRAERFSRLLPGFDGVLFIRHTQPVMVIRQK
jgi:erythromycin esterase